MNEPNQEGTRKRIVVCCDGTWNRPDSTNITNIEKIARTIETDTSRTDGIQQLVGYVSGVGVGYKLDRILGGAFGFGVFNNVRTAYRFLALNFQPGDEIYAFGFSRGAYTARSLAGMVGKVGLLSRQGLVDGNLGEALIRYREPGREPAKSEFADLREFQRECCHPQHVAKVTFLGVFDTVGALGVPGRLRKDHQFHDIDLGDGVEMARHALAIDERRRVFEPCFWKVPEGADRRRNGRVRLKQVWFEGAHSDVGGGYPERGLSNTALQWMVEEAKSAGLVFDEALLADYLEVDSPAMRHESLNLMYRCLNFRDTVLPRSKERKNLFANGRRRLHPMPSEVDVEREYVTPVMLSSTAREDYGDEYGPSNLVDFVDKHCEPNDPVWIEPTVRLPAQRTSDPAGVEETV